MANVSNIGGFQLLEETTSSRWKRWCIRPATDANVVGRGTPVILDNGGGALWTPTTYGGNVIKATASTTNRCDGIIIDVDFNGNTNTAYNYDVKFLAASTAGRVLVCFDPYALYMVQANDAVAQTDLYKNTHYVQTAVFNQTNGYEGCELETATITNDDTDAFKIMGFVSSPDNEANATSNKVIVMINNSIYKSGTAGLT